MVASPQGGSPRDAHEPELDAFDQEEGVERKAESQEDVNKAKEMDFYLG